MIPTFGFLSIVVRTFIRFWWLFSKELAVTLKCCYEKNNLAEAMLKQCLLFKAARGRLNTFSKVIFRSSYLELFYEKKCLCLWKSLRKTTVPESFFNKVSAWRLATLFNERLRRIFFSCECWGTFWINNLWQNNVDKFLKVSKNRCFCEMF